VSLATGLKASQAKRKLKEASMNVPASILMTKTKLSYREAARLLRMTRGSLQAAIALAESRSE
jgi:N-acetylmuramic acid 6-phosphate (MurNAc-6-P) etherase